MFGIRAAQSALQDAALQPSDIDLLLFVGVGRGWIEPAQANLFMAELGMDKATGFDVVDACASWIRALDLAHAYLSTGRYHRIMILNCEFNFREYAEMRFRDLSSLAYLLPAFTIGEAATAAIVTADHPEKEYYAHFSTVSSHHDLCKIPLPNHDQFRLNGGAATTHDPLKFYAYGTRLTQVTVRDLLSQYHSHPTLTEFVPDRCFSHSVSEPVTEQVERLMGFPPDTAYRIFRDHGNVVSASVPLAMSLARGDGSLVRGDRIMLIVGSAGISVGFVAMQY
jgi:3-oxoacyl-[acyl-carrier-protein] synthase III